MYTIHLTDKHLGTIEIGKAEKYSDAETIAIDALYEHRDWRLANIRSLRIKHGRNIRRDFRQELKNRKEAVR